MKLYKIQSKKLHLDLHLGQSKAWQSERRFIFVLAGTQGGKTSFGPWWLWREILNTSDPNGENDYLAVTSSYDLFKLKMLPEMLTVFVRFLGIGRYWAAERLIELKKERESEFWASKSTDPMWGRIILRSAVAGSGLESASAKAAWLDEAGQDEFTVETWEAVLRRLSLSQGRVLATTTLYNLGWIKSEIYEKWKEGDSDIDIIQFSSKWNPAFPDAEYERAKRTMPTWRFLLFYEGKFAKPAGLIYKCFEDWMKVDSFSIPNDWPRVVGVDFGGANTALVWLAHNLDTDIWYLYEESLSGSKTTKEHAEEALAKSQDFYQWEAVGGAPSESQPRRDWSAGGFWVEQPEIGEIESGIDKVIELIKSKRLRIFNDCKGTLDELGRYKRKLDAQGEATDVILNKSTFHRLDALRYAAIKIVTGNSLLNYYTQKANEMD